MGNTQKQFFSLLCAGLWNSPANSDLFSKDTEWEAIINMSRMQTVSGVLFDGVSKLPLGKQPPATLLRSLFHIVVCIEQSNFLLDKCLTGIVSAINKEDIHSVLLKGQGVARNYPNPAHRQCGDIDIYVGDEKSAKATSVLLNIGAQQKSKTRTKRIIHEDFQLGEVSIELHLFADVTWNPFRDRKFQRWTKKHLFGDKLRTCKINETNISLPPVNFDALYIFNHIFHHFISIGIGLRQICDWTLYLHTFSEHINRDDLYKDLKTFGLLKEWQVFGYIVVNNLGLPEERFPFYTNKYNISAKRVLDKILQTGNFGNYNPDRGNRPEGSISGKMHFIYFRLRWLIKLFPIFPRHVLVLYTFRLITGIYYLLKGK